LDEIRRGQRTGHIDPAWEPVELFIVLAGIARSMATPNPVQRKLAKADGRPDNPRLRREAAVEAARRLIRPAQ
jgi:hypothetical protein